ncbi:uncharacterized protein J4E87_002224 [Alternaria ethzedia]|uniref:uncharacterized protein n=1 Tax=Alternaria ethzedia TaxID=181014 RepID=UPI0020C2270C|nr:uncharacterized protein J4E87_002224 [Alternaria ethzedia]KAI4631519.1 hypothetical protein J4E87_002224 [Alternaria ethzedia]
MADEANPPVSADTTNTAELPTRSSDAVAEPAVAEAKPAEDGVIATSGVAEVPEDDAAQKDDAAKEDVTADAQAEPTTASDDADAAPASDAPATNGTPAPKKAANGKRKSGAGVPEHKKKTPAKKGKKPPPELRLNVSPGDMFMVAMRGYQPWPVIVCDEQMLPESLLSKRPVSAKRIDGTYREDFLEGGKNAKDRRYPVMFLGTNEFAWQVNTELLSFDIEEVKKDVESSNQGKKNKQLWEAYQIAAEGHDLAHFKEMLAAHESAMQEDVEQKEQKKKEKAEKSAKRKSTAPDDSEDVEMGEAGDDAAPAKKAKATKKRKKDDQSDGENEKAVKTPKIKLTTGKTPKAASAAKPKKEPKSKKKASEEAAPETPEEAPMTEEERLVKREKQVLYLRHRLQKGFLSRDQKPKDEDMTSMDEYLKQLEAHEDLEADVIRKTKVHKVLRAIQKLETIPMEDEYHFKQRSSDLLSKWTPALASEPEAAAANGVKSEDREKSESAKDEAPSAEKTTEEDKKDDANTDAAVTKTADEDGDVQMSEADKEVIKDAPAAQEEAEKSAEGVEKATAEPETAAAATDDAST